MNYKGHDPLVLQALNLLQDWSNLVEWLLNEDFRYSEGFISTALCGGKKNGTYGNEQQVLFYSHAAGRMFFWDHLIA